MPEPTTPEIQRYSPEKMREDYREMAQRVIGVVDSIIDHAHLTKDKDPKGPTLWWLVHGKNSPDAHFLHEAAGMSIDRGTVIHRKRGRGIHLDFEYLTMEPNLRAHYGDNPDKAKTAVTVDIARKLGFFDGQTTKKEIELYGIKPKTYSHPTKPFDIKLEQNGVTFDRAPILPSFSITHR